jgi:SAM-dependent methyltransferase|uniref:class I SAM-dependent methyltransferase n=1 Tax=Prosthecobacter sp. TaxID=1965333 RepID=UPI00378404F1
MNTPVSQQAAGREEASFDGFASNYDQALDRGLRFTGEGKDYFVRGRVNWLRQRLEALDSQPRTCFDFGCGIGSGCDSLVAEFKAREYLGYDPSIESIKQARQFAKKPVIRFESDESAIPQAFFDLAFTNGVFHHIPPSERRKCVSTVWRALKPGGWFAFWENNRWNPLVHFLMSRVPFDLDAEMLFPHQARRLLVGEGFDVVCTDYMFIFPAKLKNLRPLESMLCKLPFGGQYMILARKPVRAVKPTS